MEEQGFGRQWAREFEARFGNHQSWHQGWPQGWPQGWAQGWGGSRGSGGPQGRSAPPPWLAGLFGLAGHDSLRGPRVRRGDVRIAILAVLAEEPLNGYQVIGQIADRSGGAWRPSPGSVYPTISQLEDEGLIESDDERGRRTLRLTDEGRAYLADHADEVAAVWAPFDGGDEPTRAGRQEWRAPDFSSLKPELGRVMSAVWQIISTGTEQQRREAIGVLVEARRQLYGILADHPGEERDDLGDGEERDDTEGAGS